ncbi:Uncharacterised protein [Serratia quinivorans]|uniref:hypothetical protein n=1 Tax=Serratia quinivorans TaxID=137545 RepID=UPI00217965F1|nr:hypothetical protein [Serratia quinivorans]CAI1513218.1 Uncharacterised protein [Serratia quinivorans]
MAKAKWPKLPRLLVPLFECAQVYLCTTRDEWEQAYTVLGLEPDALHTLAGCVRLVENRETGERIILIGVFTGELHVLAHECAHAAFRICETCGVEITRDGNNETYCYLLDKLFRFAEGYVKKPAVC